MATTELAVVLTAKDQASAQITKMRQSVVSLGPATADVNRTLGSFGPVSIQAGQGATALGVAAAGAGVALAGTLAAGLAASVSAATEFEKTMSGVRAVSGASGQEMQQLSALALQLGQDTAFSASQAAAGLEELVKGGVSVADIMGGAAKSTLALAAAGGVDMASAAEIAANALNTFSLKGSDMAHVADLIAGAANASAIGVNDFRLSLAASGAVANTVGLSFDDLAVGIAAMGNAGIKGSDAGTSLKTMLLNLQPVTKAQQEEFKRLGLITAEGANKFFDAQGKVKGLADISQVLQGALSGMTKQQQLATLEVLFGSDAIRAAAVLAKEGATGINELTGSMAKVGAEGVAKMRLDNLAGDVEQLKGSLETLAITVGSAFTEPLRALAMGFKTAIDSATNLLRIREVLTINAEAAERAGISFDIFGNAVDRASGEALSHEDAMKRVRGEVERTTKAGLDAAQVQQQETKITELATAAYEKHIAQLHAQGQLLGPLSDSSRVYAQIVQEVRREVLASAAAAKANAEADAELQRQWEEVAKTGPVVSASVRDVTKATEAFGTSARTAMEQTTEMLSALDELSGRGSGVSTALSALEAVVRKTGMATEAQIVAIARLRAEQMTLQQQSASLALTMEGVLTPALQQQARILDPRDVEGAISAREELQRIEENLAEAVRGTRKDVQDWSEALGREAKKAAEETAKAIDRATDALGEMEKGLASLTRSFNASMGEIRSKLTEGLADAASGAAADIADAARTAEEQIAQAQGGLALSRETRTRRAELDRQLADSLRAIEERVSAEEDAFRKSQAASRRAFEHDRALREIDTQLDIAQGRIRAERDRELARASTEAERRRIDDIAGLRFQDAAKAWETAKADLARREQAAQEEREFSEKQAAELAAKQQQWAAAVAEERKRQASIAQRFSDQLENEALSRTVVRAQQDRDARVKAIGEALAEKTRKVQEDATNETNALREQHQQRIRDLQEQVIDRLPELTGKADRTLTEFLGNVRARIAEMAQSGIADAAGVATALAGIIDTAVNAQAAVARVAQNEAERSFFGTGHIPGIPGLQPGEGVEEYIKKHFQVLNQHVGHRAAGGPTMAGQPYWVGERGPELFVPHGGGTVVPNDGLGGHTFNFNFSGAQITDREQLKRDIRTTVEQGVRDGSIRLVGR